MQTLNANPVPIFTACSRLPWRTGVNSIFVTNFLPVPVYNLSNQEVFIAESSSGKFHEPRCSSVDHFWGIGGKWKFRKVALFVSKTIS